jgi:hypothetical protein
MATKSKKTQLGSYIRKVNGYDIRQKVTMKKNDKGKMQVSTSELVVYRGKKLIKAGFKNIESATEYANAN